MLTIRFRSLVWFLTGAMLATAVTLMFVTAWRVDAAPGDQDTTFVPLTSCRLTDTRPGSDRVGTNGAWGVADTKTLQATGVNGNCTIPTQAVGLSMKVFALNATSDSFLTFWDAGPLPLGSALNPTPTGIVFSAVTTSLSPTGSFKVYNDRGTVDVIIEINGYYTKNSLKQLNNRVTALEKAQPFTVASAPIVLVEAQGGETEIRRVTVKAPVKGRVAVIASGSVYAAIDGSTVKCGLMNRVADPPDTFGAYWESPTGADISMLSATRVFNIAAGATATYYLVCYNINPGLISIFAPQMTAIFTPTP